MIETYNKFEFKLLQCNNLTPQSLIKKLNELGQNGWEVVRQFGGSLFANFDGVSILLQRKIKIN